MSSNKKILVYLIGGFLFAFAIGLLIPKGTSRLEEAEQYYVSGERAATALQRKDAFNHALKNYLELEKHYHPDMGNGKLYYNIANTYYQLQEYPQAIYYYYKATALRPRDEKVLFNLGMAEKALGIAASPQPSAFQNLLFFHFAFSVPQRLQMLSFLLIIFFGLLTLQIWHPRRIWNRIAYPVGFLAVLLLLSLTYFYYFAPIEAITIQASSLYRGAGKHYAHVIDKPLSSGLKVHILESLENGQWIKIETLDGTLGYLPSDRVRILINY